MHCIFQWKSSSISMNILKTPPEFYFHWNRGLEKWMVDAAGYLETGIYKGFYIHPLQILSMPFK
ncbi:hypothetical protein [Thermococcus atlanticus]